MEYLHCQSCGTKHPTEPEATRCLENDEAPPTPLGMTTNVLTHCGYCGKPTQNCSVDMHSSPDHVLLAYHCEEHGKESA